MPARPVSGAGIFRARIQRLYDSTIILPAMDLQRSRSGQRSGTLVKGSAPSAAVVTIIQCRRRGWQRELHLIASARDRAV